MLTRPNYSVTNVQGLADLTKDQATLVKQTMDKTGSDTKTFLIALLDELESVSGAENIGITETIAGSGTNVKARVEWLKAQIDAALLGQVPLGSLTDDYLSNAAGQLKSVVSAHLADFTQQIPYAVTTGTANTYVVSTTPALPALVAGVAITAKFHVANTGASTLNWDGKGAISIKKANGSAVSSGNLKLNGVYTLRYDGTNFILQGEGGEYGTALQGDVRNTKTLGTENGVVSGTLDLSQLIAANIRSGVTIDGVLGTLIEGKRWAKGNAVASSAAPYGFTVTGLSFKPSIVVGRYSCNNNTGNWSEFISKDYFSDFTLYGGPVNINYNSVGTTAANHVMNSDGFTFAPNNNNFSGVTIYWLAIE